MRDVNPKKTSISALENAANALSYSATDLLQSQLSKSLPVAGSSKTNQQYGGDGQPPAFASVLHNTHRHSHSAPPQGSRPAKLSPQRFSTLQQPQRQPKRSAAAPPPPTVLHSSGHSQSGHNQAGHSQSGHAADTRNVYSQHQHLQPFAAAAAGHYGTLQQKQQQQPLHRMVAVSGIAAASVPSSAAPAARSTAPAAQGEQQQQQQRHKNSKESLISSK